MIISNAAASVRASSRPLTGSRDLPRISKSVGSGLRPMPDPYRPKVGKTGKPESK